MGISRLVRSLFLSIREREFVEAAKAVGVRDRRIIFRHILPNAVSPIVVVGLADRRGQHHRRGVRQLPRLRRQPDLPDLGQHPLQRADVHPAVGNWWWPFFPGLAIILTVLAVNFIGDGLRDALRSAVAGMTDVIDAAPSAARQAAADPNVLLDVREPPDLLPRPRRRRPGGRRRSSFSLERGKTPRDRRRVGLAARA